MTASFNRTAECERQLLQRATHWPEYSHWSELTVAALQRVAQQHGVDFATALLYDRLLHSAEHGPFMERLEKLSREETNTPRLDATVVIAPGAFYVEFPQTGADGRLLREEAARFGCRSELVPLASFGSLKENERILRDWLLSRPPENVILVSLSKSGAEVKLALARADAPEVFRHVICWINLSGLANGTPLVDWLFAHKLRTCWVRFLFVLRRYNFAAIRDLRCGPGTLLAGDLRLPQHMRAIHVVGFPLARHLTNALARRCYRRLRHLGPNDGAGILLGDVCRLPGNVYPVWGADHYLRPSGRDLRDLARAIFLYLHEELGERGAGDSLTNSVASGAKVSV
jgi:hypothetical protein